MEDRRVGRQTIAATADSDRFDSLCQRQQELENQMLDRGQRRFSDTVSKNILGNREASQGAGKKLLADSIEPVTRGIQEFIDGANGIVDGVQGTRPRGRTHIAVRILTQVGAQEAALITSKAVIDHLSTKTPAVRMAMKIAGMLLDELRYRKFREHRPDCITKGKGKKKCADGCTARLFEWKLRNFNTSSYVHMKRSLDASMHFAKVDVSEFNLSESHKILLGSKCLDIFVQKTHYVDIHRGRSKDQQETDVIATQATLDWVERCNASLEFLTPIYMPTVIPPRPWSNTHNGGYWFGLAGEFSLMRTDGRHQLEELDNIEMPVVYNAINALQETSWGINERVLSVLDAMKAKGNKNAALPSYEEEALPSKPVDIETNEEARKKWRKAAHEVHERNHARRSKALGLAKTVATARMLSQEVDEDGRPLNFYFPYNLDFRGRAYAIPLYLQPQGDDIQKGLLQFGDGKALGTQAAADWLAIHGANCLADAPGGEKLDKLPLRDRISWIERHTPDILQVAGDPLQHSWWTAADSPFCFLAFCFEWAGYQREGLSFVSHIPIAMDGSCNGLQHYSALLRDEKGGREVNLLPSDTPKDIYRTVADKVVALLQAAVISRSEGWELALAWLTWGKVDRKFVKRQVMTLPYGSKKFGFRDQIRVFVQSLDKLEQPGFVSESEDDGFAHYTYMASTVWDALADTVVAACTCMEYFQKLAGICVKAELPISWTAPNGLPIVEGYREESTKRIDTVLTGLIFAPRYYETTKRLDRRKQVSGIAPNVIHSLDASAMMLTVVAAREQGIDHFAMIHDSYGTHAAQAAALAKITRDEFIRMYRDSNVLENLERGMLASVDITSSVMEGEPVEIPERPPFGALQLDSVRESLYFFA